MKYYHQYEDRIILDQISDVQNAMMLPTNLGILKPGTKSDFREVLNSVDLFPLMQIETRDQFDHWLDEEVVQFHSNMYDLYRENLVVDEDTYYSYSARLLTQYAKAFCIRCWFNSEHLKKVIALQHPIISNQYLKTFPELGISRVNQVESQEFYYDVVGFYRDIINSNDCNRHQKLLELRIGVDY